jgi:hypothetical protein
MPEGFENRRGDNWHTQFAIADLAGADWGDQARGAATKIEAGSDATTSGVRLLAATRAILTESADGAIGSQELIGGLIAHPDSEWAEWRNGKAITQAQLARLLKPFHIFADRVQVGGQRVRGYHRAQFEDAWAIYLPPPGKVAKCP